MADSKKEKTIKLLNELLMLDRDIATNGDRFFLGEFDYEECSGKPNKILPLPFEITQTTAHSLDAAFAVRMMQNGYELTESGTFYTKGQKLKPGVTIKCYRLVSYRLG